jgi:hypothetical protein
MHKTMTLIEFKKTLKWLQGVVFAFPIISKIFDHRSGVPFPPMGDDSATWRFFAVVIVGLSAFIPYFLLPQKWKGWIIGGLFLLLILSGVNYLNLGGKYVLSVTYTDGAVRNIIRGTARNPELKEPYASMNDYDLIRNSGQSDLRLEHVYTKESLRTNRQKMFWSYVLSLALMEFTLGSIARAE